jgi:hypothetical protein
LSNSDKQSRWNLNAKKYLASLSTSYLISTGKFLSEVVFNELNRRQSIVGAGDAVAEKILQEPEVKKKTELTAPEISVSSQQKNKVPFSNKPNFIKGIKNLQVGIFPNRWRHQFDMLRAYALEKGCDVNDGATKMKKQLQTRCFGTHVPNKNEPYGQVIAQWCRTQRKAFKNEHHIAVHGVKNKIANVRISEARIAQLEEVGFAWDASAYWWYRNFNILQAYGMEAGCTVNDNRSKMKKQRQSKSFGTHVANKNEEYGLRFASWCYSQRNAFKNEQSLAETGVKISGSRISMGQMNKLKSIGFSLGTHKKRELIQKNSVKLSKCSKAPKRQKLNPSST